jgi:hypothetical protein
VTPARRDQIDASEAKPRPAPSSSAAPSLDDVIATLADLDADQLRLQWRNHLGGPPPAHLPRWLLARVLAQRVQAMTLGDLDKARLRMIRQATGGDGDGSKADILCRAPPGGGFVASIPKEVDQIRIPKFWWCTQSPRTGL